MARSKKKTGNKGRVTVNRKHKDTVFRMLFRDKRNLLNLYNALNNTKYTDPEELEIVTLENAVYMNMKNDLAVLMEDYLNLYEHQSTYSPNMPLREFLLKNKKEATEMCIFEYDEEATLQYLGEEKYEEGKRDGIKQGKQDGIEEERVALIERMLKKGKQPEEIADLTGYEMKEILAVQEKLLHPVE